MSTLYTWAHLIFLSRFTLKKDLGKLAKASDRLNFKITGTLGPSETPPPPGRHSACFGGSFQHVFECVEKKKIFKSPTLLHHWQGDNRTVSSHALPDAVTHDARCSRLILEDEAE